MNTHTTRRGAIAAAAATIATAAIASSAQARPIVTRWHKLQRRADQLRHWRDLHRVGYAASRRELEHQLHHLTELVADLTDALVDEHTNTEAR